MIAYLESPREVSVISLVPPSLNSCTAIAVRYWKTEVNNYTPIPSIPVWYLEHCLCTCCSMVHYSDDYYSACMVSTVVYLAYYATVVHTAVVCESTLTTTLVPGSLLSLSCAASCSTSLEERERSDSRERWRTRWFVA